MLPYRHQKVTFQLSKSHTQLLRKRAKKNRVGFSDELRYAVYYYLANTIFSDENHKVFPDKKRKSQ